LIQPYLSELYFADLMAKAYPSEDLMVEESYTKTNHIHVFDDGGGAAGGFPYTKFYQQSMQSVAEKKGEVKDRKSMNRLKTLDCTPFLHSNSLLADFFELGGYRCFPDVVMCEIMFREIISVDAVNSTWTCDFILTTRWYDRAFDTVEYHNQTNKLVYATSIPHLTIKDVDYSFEGRNIPSEDVTDSKNHKGWVRLRKAKDPPGVLYRSQRIQVKLRDVNTLYWFPFDTCSHS